MGKHRSKAKKVRRHGRRSRPGEHRKRTEREETRKQAQRVWDEVVAGSAAIGEEHRHHR